MLKEKQLLSHVRVVQMEGHIVSNMNNEKVMLSVTNGKYYNLGEIGGVIWDMIEKPISIEKVINSLFNMYEVNYQECEEQVILFLSSLQREGLLTTSE
ncbi:lasso peptide biosynthesis PqqD family chaperone [Bacillus sp. RAR_GA_16]|uniref:lasso peptide biosynthesis PqqD family chaperone n=1 Tax=Bacillus sp. RAR_GA_16 TaxID=2876774 RepID=UPI001CCDDAB5|nr:lasso peptide biosynthesis PqqD family chaperone [Bacillus sp. RAR_GA_16]MCA0172250.1 lasso peptide biosynthesis PqqD family chaperone [Bacillus sp. RAR_GA_16]